MKPNITDELLASLIEMSTDIAEITEVLTYVEPLQSRLTTLIKELEGVRNNEKHRSNAKKGYDHRERTAY